MGIRSSYSLPNKVLSQYYVVAKNATAEAAIKSQTDDIKTLGKGSDVQINIDTSNIPKTVGTVIIDDQTTLKMDLKGIVDFKAEIQRLNKNLQSMLPALNNLEKKVNAPGYEENVKEELKTANRVRLEGLQQKKSDIEEAIANFENEL